MHKKDAIFLYEKTNENRLTSDEISDKIYNE